MIQSHEPEEQTEIWIHHTNGEADGMLLIAAEAKELTVINALGIGNPQDLSKIGGQFGVPQIGNKPAESGKD